MAIDLETYRKLSTEERRELPLEERLEIFRIAARYHEAGHTVMAYHNMSKYTIKSVTATDEIQHTEYRCATISTYADFWREACITLAGPFAEQIAFWGEVRPQPWEEFLPEVELIREDEGLYEDMGNCDDMQLLEALEGMSAARDDDLRKLEALKGKSAAQDLSAKGYWKFSLKDLYDQTVEATRVTVSEDWSEIEAVASALESTGYLDGPEVEKIIKGTG